MATADYLPPSDLSARLLEQYESRFGPRIGEGELAGFLGDPAKFDFPLVQQCNYWLPATDPAGNVYFILVLNSDGEPLYDWPRLGKRFVDSYQDARKVFLHIEGATIAKSHGIGQGIGDLNEFVTNRSIFGQGITNLPAYNSSGVLVPTAHSKEAIYQDDSIVTKQGRGWIPVDSRQPWGPTILEEDMPLIRRADPIADMQVNRLYVKVEMVGHYFFACVNPILRIGYLTGIQGNIEYGDDFVGEIARTIADIALIVVGIILVRPGLVIGRALDIVTTWLTYAGDINYQYLMTSQTGRTVKTIAVRDASCDYSLPARDWVDSVKGVFSWR